MAIRNMGRLPALLVMAALTTDVALSGTVAMSPVVSPGHRVLQFRCYPGPGTRAELVRRGVHVLAYVPPSGLVISSEAPWDSRGLDLLGWSAVDPAAKISPAFAHDSSGAYLAVFYGDVNREAARRLAENAGLEILERDGLLPGHLLLAGSWEGMRALTERDEVWHVLPPSKELIDRRPIFGCSGPISEAGVVADYVLEGTQWPASAGGAIALTYWFDSMTAKLTESVVSDQVSKAFQQWAQYTNVTITVGEGPAAARAIDILFATGAHGDAYPFTSAATLAHAFYPVPANPEPQAGDIHFNDVESWDTATGIDLFSVALHEAGHSLGLAHSSDPNSVMYAYYHVVTGLTDDDIAGIQALYGKPAGAQVPTAPTQPQPPAQPQPPSTPGGGGATAPPSLTIVSPGSSIVSVYTSSLTISGTASDNVGVTSVTWSTSTGGSGVASGTTNWSATVPLLIGNTTVTMRAFDAAGNSCWRAITVVRVD